MGILTDLCCGLTLPVIIIFSTIIILYLKNKGYFMKLRNLKNNDEGVAVFSRLIALGFASILLVVIHGCNAFGVDVWNPLISISFASGLLISAIVIVVLGLKVGFYYPCMIIFLIWCAVIYIYIQFEAKII